MHIVTLLQNSTWTASQQTVPFQQHPIFFYIAVPVQLITYNKSRNKMYLQS